MNAVTYFTHDDIRIEKRPIPVITNHELLVQVHGCGLCGSDIGKIIQQAPPPVILGHELTGTIVERGTNVNAFAVGQRVIVAHHVPCGACHYCQHRNYSMCATFKATNIDPGGFAEYIRVPAPHVQSTTLPLPETLSAMEGSFTEPLACCVRAIRRTPLQAGDSVVIMGLGSVGLLMLQAARTLTGVHVIGVDLLPERLQLARTLGAEATILAPESPEDLRKSLMAYTEGRGADAIIITAPGVRPFQQALAGVRRGGCIHIFAAYTGPTPLPLETLYQHEISILTTYSSSPEELRIALELLVSGQVRVKDLISHRLPLTDFHEGVRLMRAHAALKVYFQIVGEL